MGDRRGDTALRRRRRAGGRRLLSPGFPALLGALALLAGAAAAAPGRGKESPLEEGLQFYKGKTVTFVSPTTAGAIFDVEQRLMAPYLAEYLHANVEVEDVPGANQIVGQDAVAGSTPNGLTIGLMSTGSDAILILLGVAALDFNPAHEVFLAGNHAQDSLFVVQPSSPYRSFADLERLTSPAHPLTEVMQTTGTTTFTAELLSKVFAIPTTFYSAYANASQLEQGYLRGDGVAYYNGLATMGPLVPAKARPLAVEFPVPKGTSYTTELSGVPSFAELAKRDPPRTRTERQAWAALQALDSLGGFIFYAPLGVPVPEVEALRAAFRFALTDRVYNAAALSDGFGTGWVSGATAKADYLLALTTLKKALSATGLISG